MIADTERDGSVGTRAGQLEGGSYVFNRQIANLAPDAERAKENSNFALWKLCIVGTAKFVVGNNVAYAP